MTKPKRPTRTTLTPAEYIERRLAKDCQRAINHATADGVDGAERWKTARYRLLNKGDR